MNFSVQKDAGDPHQILHCRDLIRPNLQKLQRGSAILLSSQTAAAKKHSRGYGHAPAQPLKRLLTLTQRGCLAVVGW